MGTSYAESLCPFEQIENGNGVLPYSAKAEKITGDEANIFMKDIGLLDDREIIQASSYEFVYSKAYYPSETGFLRMIFKPEYYILEHETTTGYELCEGLVPGMHEGAREINITVNTTLKPYLDSSLKADVIERLMGGITLEPRQIISGDKFYFPDGGSYGIRTYIKYENHVLDVYEKDIWKDDHIGLTTVKVPVGLVIVSVK